MLQDEDLNSRKQEQLKNALTQISSDETCFQSEPFHPNTVAGDYTHLVGLSSAFDGW